MSNSETQHGTVFWSELVTPDVSAAKAFYGATCGWSFDDMPMENGTYVTARSGDKIVAGIMDMNALPHLEGVMPHWFTYLAIQDMGAAIEAGVASGGTIMRDPFDVAGIGRIAIVADSTGAVVGLIEPAPCD